MEKYSINFARVVGNLILHSDLHIGTGLYKEKDETRSDDAEEARAALICLNSDGEPVIPGTSLKGALRAASQRLDSGSHLHLFGNAHDDTRSQTGTDNSSGSAGAVLFDNASYLGEQACKLSEITRSSIDRDTGATKQHHLFKYQLVPAGTRFKFNWIYRPRLEDVRGEAEKHLFPFLTWLSQHGVQLGKGTRFGQGLISLESARISYHTLGSSGTMIESKTQSFSTAKFKSPCKGYLLKLSCKGPYLTVAYEKSVQSDDIDIQCRLNAKGEPALDGTMVIGSLRSACARFESAIQNLNLPDDPEKELKTGESPAKLTHTERLFGLTGWRGLVSIRKLENKKRGEVCLFAGVPIDRFTGGTMDSGPIVVKPFVDVEYEANISLDARQLEIQTEKGERSREEYPTENDKMFFQCFLDHLSGEKGEGLFLGWGAARGFGWFKVNTDEDTKDHPPLAAKSASGTQSRKGNDAQSREPKFAEPFGGYRFIPLSKSVKDSPSSYPCKDKVLDRDEVISHAKAVGRISGFIDVSWKNYTPLCIGRHNSDQRKKNQEGKEKTSNTPVSPFKLGNQYTLPGASLRGMLRSVVEIATFSHLGQINTEHQFGFRDFSDAYHRCLTKERKEGWLMTNGEEYWIQPAKSKGERKFGSIVNSLNNSKGNSNSTTFTKWLRMDHVKKYTELAQNRQLQQRDSYTVCAGKGFNCGNKTKNHEDLFGPPETRDETRIAVSEKDLIRFARLYSTPKRNATYSVDHDNLLGFWLKQLGWSPLPGEDEETAKDRHTGPSKLKGIEKYPGIPIYYVVEDHLRGENDPGRVAISMTSSFKYPYFNNVGAIAARHYGNDEYIIPKLKQQLDYARAIFGDIDDEHGEDKKDALKGRVFFECARMIKNKTEINAKRIELTLSQPKASYISNYLKRVRNPYNKKDKRELIADYSDYVTTNGIKRWPGGARLAGRKRYPVREVVNSTGRSHKEGSKSVVWFVPPEQIFKGRIKFVNLLEEELGALLWSLRFGENIRADFYNNDEGEPTYQHAIGRAKAFGFGRLGAAKIDLHLYHRPDSEINRADEFIKGFEKDMYELWDDEGIIELLKRMADPSVGEKKQMELNQPDLKIFGRRRKGRVGLPDYS